MGTGAGGIKPVDAKKVETLPSSMLLAFSSNVLLELVLEMTTQVRREELCVPLHVALTVHRAAKKLLKFARPTTGSKNAVESSLEAMRSSPTPMLSKMNL